VLTSPEGLTGPMALSNPACSLAGQANCFAVLLKGAYPLQTTPYVSEILRISETLMIIVDCPPLNLILKDSGFHAHNNMKISPFRQYFSLLRDTPIE